MADLVVIGGIFREQLPGARRPGGSGFVAALTAAAMGVDVALFSFVGEQDSTALRPLRRAGVNVDAVQILPGKAGIFAFTDELEERAPRPTYRSAEHLPSSAAWGDCPTAAVVLAFGFPDFDPRQWISAAVQEQGTVVWDLQGWLSREIEPEFFAALPVARRVNLANLAEAKASQGTQTAFAALSEVPPEGFQAAVVKAGRWGTLVASEDNVHMVGAFTTIVNSAIGSGDCFAGALAAGLATGTPLPEAARLGAAAASLYVERAGNRPPPALNVGVADAVANRPQVFVGPVVCEDLRVYLAGPWFTVAESMLISQLEAVLEHLGLAVVSPRRDIRELGPGASADEIWEVGREDYRAIDSCQLVVAVLDHDDPGTLMELGYAHKAKKPIVGLRSQPDNGPQPMREAAEVRVATTVSQLVDEVTAWVRETRGIA